MYFRSVLVPRAVWPNLAGLAHLAWPMPMANIYVLDYKEHRIIILLIVLA